MVKTGAEALVTGLCGPKAFRVLDAAGVKVFNIDVPIIAEALTRWHTGLLVPAGFVKTEGGTI